ncbi:hypothetical protein [Serratia grimesii]|uniref:hypothetical protein n=1 Tax=Serratia grimesii TaxID=82995 RepID=UPI001F4C30FD|nr:hypothetical protein [Serratia grimesii]
MGGFIAVIRSKQKSAFERHFTMNQSALLSIANDLNHDQTRVLMVLLADRDYENFIYISQVEMAEEFNVQKKHVNRDIKNIIEFSLLLEGPKIGISKVYRLNHHFGWKGTITNHKKNLSSRLSLITGGLANDI